MRKEQKTTSPDLLEKEPPRTLKLSHNGVAKEQIKPGMVTLACNLNILEFEAGG
jgi:hypothetical protein